MLVRNELFQTPYYVPGGLENLPEELRPHLSLLATPKGKSRSPAVNPRGAFRAPKESESESKPSDKEPDQQLKDSSDLIGTSSILSPLTGLSLSGQGESIETDPPEPPKDEPDPFKEDFVDASEHPDHEPIQVDPPRSPTPLPPTPPDPPADPPIMATTPSSLLGTCPSFKGK